MKYFTTSDKGKVRENNEDSYFNYSSDKFSLFLLADGMGGYKAGEVASKMAVDIASKEIIENFDEENIFDIIASAIKKVNIEINSYAQNNSECSGMGTTLILSLIHNNILYYANVGDSRIYLYRDKNLKQITKDHSVVQELLDSGAITEEEAKFYPRNRITSALGTSIDYKIEINKLELSENQYILMTSDGLTDMIDDNDILDVLYSEYAVRESCEILQYMANSTGGKDNITITIVKV